MTQDITIEKIATFAKSKGFVYPTAEIYGGCSGFFEFGPLGSELKNNMLQSWWKRFVKSRQDIVGIDGSNVLPEKVWKASGHLDNFSDIMVKDVKTGKKYRADHLAEDALEESMEGKSADEIFAIIKEKAIKSPDGNDVKQTESFNLMFPLKIGVDQDQTAYMRGETAQNIFTNFRQITQTTRVQLPFGIAQIGRAYRNEISPRDFLFRVREFEQMEIEFFYDPEADFTLFSENHRQQKINVLTEELQDAGKEHKEFSFGSLVDSKKMQDVHAYWICECLFWFESLGLKRKNLRLREHTTKELSHYSSATFDIEYNFPHMGFKEIYGNAHRGNYDLSQHQKHSKQTMEIHDDRNNKKVLPEVIEPSFGLGRAFLAVLCELYEEDVERKQTILHFPSQIAPYTVGVFPLVKKLSEHARKIYNELKEEYAVFYDESGSIGKRYARQDEIGTPYCVTVDFETIEQDDCITLRDRDSTDQVRVPKHELDNVLYRLTKKHADFDEIKNQFA